MGGRSSFFFLEENNWKTEIYGDKVKWSKFRFIHTIWSLKDLQDRYVLAPAHKAGNNVIYNLQKYYNEVMCKEHIRT